ncbi:MAG: response regulator transcription factor [Clostridiales bacterium]|nr:response regulator transcription factor [Clostridiales bacterium]
MVTVLIADDDTQTREQVSELLSKNGYHVLQAKDGRDAMDAVDKNISALSLIILDMIMPVCDGLCALRYIRKLSASVPAIMLTTNGCAEEAPGLELGIHDFIEKPINPAILSARIHSILDRHTERISSKVEQLGEFRIDEKRREVWLKDKILLLTLKEYELLVYFKNNKNVAVSREKILNAVWGYDYFGGLRTVDTHVKKLRAKLAGYRDLIQTVRGYGYRFETDD